MKQYPLLLIITMTLVSCSSMDVKEMSCTELRKQEASLSAELKELNIDRLIGVVGILTNDKDMEADGDVSGVAADITEDELEEVRAEINNKKCTALSSHSKK